MIKKKLNILLLLSLVLLFIGSLSISYASVDTTEIKNFILNSYCYDYTTSTYDTTKIEDVTTFINNHESEINSLSSYTETYPDSYVLMLAGDSLTDSSLTKNLIIWITSTPIYNTGNYISITSGNMICRAAIKASNNTFALYTTGSSSSGYSSTWLKYYSNNAIYTDNTYETVKYPAGVHPSGLLSSPYYTDDYFAFDINSDFTTVRLQNDQTLNEYYLIESSNNEYIRIGNQYDFSNLKGITKRKFRYNIGSGQFDLINEYQSDLTNSDYFTINVSEDICILYEDYQPDVIEVISLIPFDLATYQQIDIYLYFKSRYTSIVNGVVDFDNTFSGDYYNNYNNDTNTDKVIDNIKDDTQVDNTLNNFISGDAEDIANKFGFHLFTQEYYNFIHDTIVSLTDVLMENEDVYFDYSMHGEAPTRIYASSFTTPNGTLKTFLSMFLISCTVFAFYKYISDLLELISTGNILEALDEFKVDRNIFKM